MILRRSRFIHQLCVGADRFLIVHAIRNTRLPADREIGILIDYFAEPRRIPNDCDGIGKLIPYSRDVIARSIAGLVERDILTEKTPEQELAAAGAELSGTHGRDPAEMLDRYGRNPSAPPHAIRDRGWINLRVPRHSLGVAIGASKHVFAPNSASRERRTIRVNATGFG